MTTVLVSLCISVPGIFTFRLAEEYRVISYDGLLEMCKQWLCRFAGRETGVLDGLALLANDLFFSCLPDNLNGDCHVFGCS